MITMTTPGTAKENTGDHKRLLRERLVPLFDLGESVQHRPQTFHTPSPRHMAGGVHDKGEVLFFFFFPTRSIRSRRGAAHRNTIIGGREVDRQVVEFRQVVGFRQVVRFRQAVEFCHKILLKSIAASLGILRPGVVTLRGGDKTGELWERTENWRTLHGVGPRVGSSSGASTILNIAASRSRLRRSARGTERARLNIAASRARLRRSA